jgi:hypothetical protein
LYSSLLAGRATALRDKAIRLKALSSDGSQDELLYKKAEGVGITTASSLYFSQSFLTLIKASFNYFFG